jgi:hypothetical protein
MRRSVAAALLALLLGGCASDFLPASYLNDLRVLAILADPLEVGPGQQVALRPAVYLPPGAAISSQRWTFCPLSAGSVSGYSCAVPQCQVDLPFAADGSTAADPSALAQQCLAAAGGSLPAALPETVEVTFAYQVASTQGQSRQAVLQLPLWTQGPPPDPNRPPVIERVEIGGVPVFPAPGAPAPLPAGAAVAVHVVIDPASVQTYLDAAGTALTETMTASYYATAGRLSADRATGVDTAVDLEAIDLEEGQTGADVYVVVRDLRGGQALAGPFTVPILR